MIQQSTSRIRRGPPGTRDGMSGLANPHARRLSPMQNGIGLLAFVGALITLGFFIMTNWSSDQAPEPQASQIAELSQPSAETTSPSALGSFYKGDRADPDNPIILYNSPVLAEDGSGQRVRSNAYGEPTSRLFQSESGGWGVSRHAAQSDLH